MTKNSLLLLLLLLWASPGLNAQAYKSVVISEIFADPDKSVACMPSIEFLELYNRSSQPVDLQGWTIADATTQALITGSSFVLLPGEYVVLSLDSSVFPGVLKIELPVWPSLNNAGDALGLRNNLGGLVDTVDYDISMYQNPISAQGGWSLELINPGDTCSGRANWIASVDPCGGTPGMVNSVFSTAPDTTPPTLQFISVTNMNTLELCFSEPVDSVYATNASCYSIDNGIGAPIAVVATGAGCVTLTLSTPINPGTSYTVTATCLQDCHGNSAPTSITLTLTAIDAPDLGWEGWSIYPNPAADAFQLRNVFPTHESIAVHIHDMYGHLRVQTDMPASAREAALDIRALAPGIYTVGLLSGGGEGKVLKLVVE